MLFISQVTISTRRKHRHILAVAGSATSSSVQKGCLGEEIISLQFVKYVDSKPVNTLPLPNIKEWGLSLWTQPQSDYLGCAVRRCSRPNNLTPQEPQRSSSATGTIPVTTRGLSLPPGGQTATYSGSDLLVMMHERDIWPSRFIAENKLLNLNSWRNKAEMKELITWYKPHVQKSCGYILKHRECDLQIMATNTLKCFLSSDF